MTEDANLETPAAAAPVRTSGLAVASLVLGIVGLLLVPAVVVAGQLLLVPIVASILAAVLGHVARRQIRRDPALQGKGLARAGLILGWIEIVLWALLALLFAVLLAIGFTPG